MNHLPMHIAISIHAAREGGDVVGLINGRLSSISIHAAREGGDPAVRQHIFMYR